MERLSARGHEIRVIDYEILWRQKGRSSRISKRTVFEHVRRATDNGEVTVIRPPIIRARLFDYFSLLYTHTVEIRRQLDEFKPDVIVGFGIINAFIARNLAKRRNIPFLYYVIDELHRLVPIEFLEDLAKAVESLNMKGADRIVSINEGLRDYTISMGAERSRTEVIRAGVDLDHYDTVPQDVPLSVRTTYGFSERDVVLFFMGWLYPFSGIREVVAELAKPHWKNSRIKLLIVGEGETSNEIREMVSRNGMNGVVVLEGWKDYSDLPRYVLASDICILPALRHNIMMNIVPIKMYEYMTARKPIFATRLPGLVKEFGEDNGVLYIDKPEEVLKLAEELEEGNGVQSEGIKAREFVESSSWDTVVGEFEKELTKLIERTH
jgi:glycosyltransferase involved in cell wall biosynthesis